MTTPLTEDDEMSELVDAQFGRVDLVQRGANGVPRFLIAKQDGSAGLLEPDFVRSLIGKQEARAEAVPEVVGVTLSGSPAQMAEFIHKAAQRASGRDETGDVAKAEMSSKSINDLPSLGGKDRILIAKAILAGCEYIFDGYVAPVEQSVMVGAEHENILKGVCAAMFPSHDMADIVRSLTPAADSAPIEKTAANQSPERGSASIGLDVPAPGHGGPLSDVLAGKAAISRAEACALRGKVGELLLAGGTRGSGARHALAGRIPLLKSELARIAAELRSPSFGVATTTELPVAFEAVLGFQHDFSLRQSLAKAEMAGRAQNDLPDSAFAYIESGGKKDADGKTTPRSLRHFPIQDAAHVRNALSRAPQSPFGDQAMAAIRAAAKKFGIEVSKEQPVPDAVTKDMGPELDDGIDGMDPTVALAAPDMEAPGDPAEPGSPAWEAIDAATACKWTSILSRARAAVDILAERELLEAASADPDDAENAWDLQDVCCAIDYAISVLAPFAVAEQSEADCGADAMGISKAMAGFGGVPMDRIEALSAVAKAGRVLSASNEAEIRSAAASLQKVLTSLPAAPPADDPVAKETAVPDQTAPETVEKDQAPATPEAQAANAGPVNAGGTTGMGEPRQTGPSASLPGDGPQAAKPGDVPGRQIVKGAAGLKVAVYDSSLRLAGLVDATAITLVAKADEGDGKTAMQAVFDQDGNLVGIVDPAAITPVSGAGKPGNPPDAPAPDAADMTPAPAADAGTPADGTPDDVTKATRTTPSAPAETAQPETAPSAHDVLKSFVGEMVTEALESRGQAQDIAKQADVASLREQVDVLKARLATVEEHPAAPKVFSNGQTPPAHQMRGQDRQAAGAAPQADAGTARVRKAELYSASAADQTRIAEEMRQDAVAALAALHAGR